ncbi:aminotransferase class I/II-fold pyridoxal phosphate-dependent enzyme [Bathymodiolus platifrons methanotrophic gill symbiont]|uniref:aminotransferase class I/II-fold pyridoxal phosphate-dependent enzyme n=1 Tax=Bathymodiolus platifrons methanotrophic gill symbiont TaxID=113268 RepID=UPI001E655AC5|nr:aminotransferase class I/II-fold pyridoxal phosphate-dependent enzyme [Bathymodiolus platifrons methanotrophic gill symbiont]
MRLHSCGLLTEGGNGLSQCHWGAGAFLLALGASLNPGDEVLLSDPCYPCNQNFIRLYDAKVKFVPVYADTAYQLSADLLR